LSIKRTAPCGLSSSVHRNSRSATILIIALTRDRDLSKRIDGLAPCEEARSLAMSRCRMSKTPQQSWYTRPSIYMWHLARHDYVPSPPSSSSGLSLSSASDFPILTYPFRQDQTPISPSFHGSILSSSGSFHPRKHVALPVSCLVEVCFWSLTNRLSDAKWRSPPILDWSNECLWPRNVEQGMAKLVRVESRVLQVRKTLLDAIKIWRSGGYLIGVKISVTRSLFGRINFR
jgi:hypothetical protein